MYPQFASLTWIAPYGLAMAMALLAAWLFARHRAIAVGIDPSHIDLIVPLGFIISVLGAALLAYLVPSDASLAGDYLAMPGRKRLFGMLLTVGLVLIIYSRVARLPLRRLLDVFALPFLLCVAIGRIGCLLGGCCWGDVVDPSHVNALADIGLAQQINTLPWFGGESFLTAIQYPAGSYAWQQHVALGLIATDAPRSLAVHPAPLYEATVLILLLIGFSTIEKRLRHPGQLAMLTMVSYSLLAIMMDMVRADNAAVLGPLTLTQVICVGLLASAVVLRKQIYQIAN